MKAECLGVRERRRRHRDRQFRQISSSPARGAERFLSRLMTNRMPRRGRLVLTPMLNQRGKLIGDFTIAKAGDEPLPASGVRARRRSIIMRWFEKHLPDDGSVRIQPLRHGPGRPVDRRPEVARTCCSARPTRMCRRRHSSSWTTARWRSPTCRRMVNRVTYTGDLGYEIWVRPEYQRRLYARDHGGRRREFGLVDFGMRALLSLAAREELPDLVSRASARSTGP